MQTVIRRNAVALALSLIVAPIAVPGFALAQQTAEPTKAASEAKPAAATPAAAPAISPAPADAPGAAAPATAGQAAAPANKEAVTSLMGYRLTQRPVPNLKVARVYAGEWITAGYLTDVTVGKIQNVGGLFIADLVDKANPKQLSNQLLIRKRDGFSILVYRGQSKATAEQMAGMAGMAGMGGMGGMSGMAGMEGMSGMSGMKAIQATPAAHGNFKVKSARHAKRIVDAWLLLNGLPNLTAAATRDFGGVYVTQIVTLDGKPKNQAVMRKSDGYIQLVHPVAAIGSGKK